MAFIIALAGKGGTGKTTVAALTVRYIIEKKKGPVLAVDADPNSCLNEALGVNIHMTIGRLREESLQMARNSTERPGGMSIEQLLGYKIEQSIVESEGFDLIVMGRPEGPGCYCVANNIIRKYIERLSETYPYVVVDNEAGMEHFSRRTAPKVDLLLIMSDPTVRGINTAKRINDLINELELEISRRALIINRISTKEEELKGIAEKFGLYVAGLIPEDNMISDYDLNERPIFQLPENSKAVKATFCILDRLLKTMCL